MHETWVWSLGQEDALEKEMATHSSILAWDIPWSEELGMLQSTGSQKNQTRLSDCKQFNHWLDIFKSISPLRLWAPQGQRLCLHHLWSVMCTLSFALLAGHWCCCCSGCNKGGRRKNICNVMRIKGRSRKFSTKDYSYIKPCKCKPSLPGWKGKDRIPGRGNHVCEHREV